MLIRICTNNMHIIWKEEDEVDTIEETDDNAEETPASDIEEDEDATEETDDISEEATATDTAEEEDTTDDAPAEVEADDVEGKSVNALQMWNAISPIIYRVLFVPYR